MLLVRGAFPESVENARSRIARFEKLGDSRRAITTRVTGAMTCVNLGRVAAAQTWLDQAMQLAKQDQKNGAARIPEIVLAMANLAQSDGDYAEASKQIDRAIALRADPLEIQRIQALVFAYTGYAQKSRELIAGVLDKARQKKNVGPLLQLYLDASEVFDLARCQ